MRCVVTGATGLVGANLAIELANQGYQVRCTRRRGWDTWRIGKFTCSCEQIGTLLSDCTLLSSRVIARRVSRL